MKERPLILSILVGLIVVLAIVGVSILVRMNSIDESYKKEVQKNIQLQKEMEELKKANQNLKEENTDLRNKNAELKEENSKLTNQIGELKLELEKLEKLKNKLEENLKEELIKSKQLQESKTN